MAKLQASSLQSNVHESASSHYSSRFISEGLGRTNNHRPGFPGLKKRGHAHGSRSWIKIDQNGDSKILELDKAAVTRHCSLPARDLRLFDPLFIYPSTILGREKAIVVSLELLRCIIMDDEVILMNSLEGCVVQYKSELCKRLQTNKDQSELEMEIHAVLDELASSISTLNLERVRRFKGHLLALSQRVQSFYINLQVCDEIEHLMDDDGDMAEMYLTENKQRKEAYVSNHIYDQSNTLGGTRMVSKSAPVSPVGSIYGTRKLQRIFSSMSSSKHGSYQVSHGSMLKEYIDDTEDLINIKLGNVQNQLIKFELLLTAATFVATVFCRCNCHLWDEL